MDDHLAVSMPLHYLLALPLFPFRPRTVARWHERSPLWAIYGLHTVGLCVLFLIVLLITELWTTRADIQDSLWDVLRSDPTAMPITLAVVAGGEIAFVVVSGVMMCWAGGEEPVWDTWRFTLRMSWLYVAQLWWVAGVGGICVYLVVPAYSPLMPMMAVTGIATLIVWSMASYCRALSVRRSCSPPARDPVCEWCGYSLAYIESSRACPECGIEVARSLPGSRESYDTTINRTPRKMRWLWSEDALRRVAVASHSFALMALLVRRIVIAGFLSGVALLCALLIRLSTTNNPGDYIVLGFATLFSSLFAAWVMFMLASGITTALGIHTSRLVGRNRLVAAFVAVSTSSAVFLFWGPLTAMAFGIIRPFAGFGISAPLWFALNLIVLAWFVTHVAKRMRCLQYANT